MPRIPGTKFQSIVGQKKPLPNRPQLSQLLARALPSAQCPVPSLLLANSPRIHDPSRIMTALSQMLETGEEAALCHDLAKRPQCRQRTTGRAIWLPDQQTLGHWSEGSLEEMERKKKRRPTTPPPLHQALKNSYSQSLVSDLLSQQYLARNP